MTEKNKILIVDDEEIDRIALNKILGSTYDIIEAKDGREALDILDKMKDQIAAIILDLIMPVFSGFDFMEVYHHSKYYNSIPVIIATSEATTEIEYTCLKLGAWDFVYKPYEPRVIMFRVKNLINHSQLQISKELKYRAEFDVLTDIYNKSKMFQETEEMLRRYPKEHFVFIRMDIERFQLINSFFGMAEGDNTLKFIASLMKDYVYKNNKVVYGRIEADIFAVCMPYAGEKEMLELVQKTRNELSSYPLEFDIVPTFGIYIIEDTTLSANHMYDRASLAAKHCKGNYIQNYAFYTKDMSEVIIKEQRVVNNMKHALEHEEFVLYLQPKYELQNNVVAGAEVLIRWNSPSKGLISPAEFIPVFERNGFITKLDYYVWDKTCELLRKWMDEGKHPFPVSVNISRVSLYNPRLVEVICGLVEKYHIPRALLQLELTESAYTSNPKAIQDTMEHLQSEGFTLLMDDFGSGYSSLNVLKDIEVDILKIDMKFLSDTGKQGRSENILASVVRMAKWLNMPVVAEGVERVEQVSFLRSIGCEFVQGYYFAKPVPIEEYEKVAFETPFFQETDMQEKYTDTDSLWDSTSQMEILFSNMLEAVAMYEYENGTFELLRANDAYYDLFGYSDINERQKNNGQMISIKYRGTVEQAFAQVVETGQTAECDILRELESGRQIWVNIKLKYINQVGTKHIIYGSLTDITRQKELDWELQKYRSAFSSNKNNTKTILVVDDLEINRVSLRCIFEEKYNILEAENGKEALRILEQKKEQVDLILLDIMMPVMSGVEFLEYKKKNEHIADIPVIIITSDDTTKRQTQTMELGADDYIVKPFITEIARRRVRNVLESNYRLSSILNTEER